MKNLFDWFYFPEDAGISSIAIANFLRDCEKIHYKLRTLHIVRHGKAVVEAARYPFRASDKRLVYSVSKTFTATAIGFAVQEGLVRVNDKLLDYFPECKGLDMDPRAGKITLRDVLMRICRRQGARPPAIRPCMVLRRGFLRRKVAAYG